MSLWLTKRTAQMYFSLFMSFPLFLFRFLFCCAMLRYLILYSKKNTFNLYHMCFLYFILLHIDNRETNHILIDCYERAFGSISAYTYISFVFEHTVFDWSTDGRILIVKMLSSSCRPISIERLTSLVRIIESKFKRMLDACCLPIDT